MREHWNASNAEVSLCALLARVGLVAMLAIGGAQIALGQTRPGGDRAPPPGTGALPDAILTYPAHGEFGACGEDCSHWLAAEGTVHWDGHKRIIAGLDRLADRRRPVFIDLRGQSDLGVAISIGRIFRGRGIDVGVGRTIPDQCRGVSESDCIALKLSGASLDASLSSIDTCELPCIFMLAGGVRRTLPEDTTVLIHGTQLFSRLGLNIADDHRRGLHARFREQTKLYFAQMGVDPTIADLIDANEGIARGTRLSRADSVRFRIVTGR